MPLKTKTHNLSRIEILEKGWRSLLKSLGPENAQEFVFSFPKKEKDSVKYWKKFWGDKTIDEIWRALQKSK